MTNFARVSGLVGEVFSWPRRNYADAYGLTIAPGDEVIE
jgi:hypothetical protein